MGFHNILSKEQPHGYKWIALGVLQRSMGGWRLGSQSRTPEIEVRMISNFSRAYLKPPSQWWRRWIQRLGVM